MTDILQFYARSLTGFRRRLAAVSPGQWQAATPCAEWTVRQLVGHVLDEQLWVPPLVAGETIEEVGDRFAGDQLGSDPVAAWDAAAAAAQRSLSEHGALQRTVHLSFGDFDATSYAAQVGSDTLVHTWDLARAIGADEHLDRDDLAVAEQTFAPMAEMGRSGGIFGPAVAVDPGADVQTRFLALLGRRA